MISEGLGKGATFFVELPIHGDDKGEGERKRERVFLSKTVCVCERERERACV